MSFHTSLSGLRNAQTELNVVANNIANSETIGFKKSRVESADIVAGTTYSNPLLIQGIGSTVEAVNQNFAIGSMEQTGSALDVAIAGEGFFATRSAGSGETYFTRNGSFTTDGAGFIHDGRNNRLQVFPIGTAPAAGAAVDAQVPATNAAGEQYTGVTIRDDGTLVASFADGTNQEIGRVALSTFVAPTGLEQVGSSNWQANGISGAPQWGVPGENAHGDLMAGVLERSNVDIAEELVNLIGAQRYFQANAKAIDTATQISQTVINLRT